MPIPDGTSAHAVGGVLGAVLLGPGAAVVALSTALLIQAFFFGDGGVLAYGANGFGINAAALMNSGWATCGLRAELQLVAAPRVGR